MSREHRGPGGGSGGAGSGGFASGVSDATGTTLADPQPQAELDRTVGVSMWAIVLAGGIGSRFWPLSTPERPKQVLPLVNDRPLIADTIARLSPLIPPERVLVLTSLDIEAAIHAVIPEVPGANVLAEPRPLGTAASLAWGASEIARRAGPKTVFCCLHADLAVGYPDALRFELRRAAAIASRERYLVALGAPPSRPDTAFGYIDPGPLLEFGTSLTRGGAARVGAFVEKPDAGRAAELIAGGALWNTGIYVWEAGHVLELIEEHVPEVAPGLAALQRNDPDAFGRKVRPASIERGLLERTDRLVALQTDCAWDDVGTWACLRRSRELDDDGNGAIGPAYFVDATSNVVHAENGPVVLFGVHHLLVVSLEGITFVTTLDRARELKPLLDALPGSMRLKPTRRP
ncbi:MAG: NTP transferase domain-containing protein [Gemmatimonadetes bacterium]|nr:NTP transferase domain-containing protein [Gemmatimonadota bacterium]